MFWSVLCMPYSLQHLFSDTEKKKKSVASDHTASISYLDHSVSNPHWPSAWPSPICIKMLWHKIWTYIMIAVKFYLHIPKGFPDTFFGITFHWHAFMPFFMPSSCHFCCTLKCAVLLTNMGVHLIYEAKISQHSLYMFRLCAIKFLHKLEMIQQKIF